MTNTANDDRLRISAGSMRDIQILKNDILGILRDRISDIAIDISENTNPELEIGENENDDEILLNSEINAEEFILGILCDAFRKEF